jgi:hypothetical protein
MTISAQRFATKTRTWLLIAALTQFVAWPRACHRCFPT